MTWTLETSCGHESAKIASIAVPYLQGKCLDIGCGTRLVWPGLIGIDNGHHFGRGAAAIMGDGTDLSMFADASLDGVFSSHFLEHVRGPIDPVLKEWWRVLKVGGHLTLYLPHKDLYPNIGEPGANPDHQRDMVPDDVLSVMQGVGSWTLLENEVRDQTNEYSFYLVFRKEESGKPKFNVWQRNPSGKKRALVVRYGAVGDSFVAASVFPQLKKQGFHLTVNCKPSTHNLLKHDPFVDDWIIQSEDFVPNHELGPYWESISERYDHVVNLCESVEGSLLTLPGRLNHAYPDATRRILYDDVNYLERTHDIAAVPHDFGGRFYPTINELREARGLRDEIAAPIIVWAINGSSPHKVYPWTQVVTKWLLERTPAHVFLYADPGIGRQLQDGIIECLRRDGCDLTRVHGVAGDWEIRKSLTFAKVADVVVGPETGPLNAVAMERDVAKVIYLSHSTAANLTKHWKNTVTLEPDRKKAPCAACHRLHFDWSNCHQDEATSAALCASSIAPDVVFKAIVQAILPKFAEAAD